MNTAFYVLYGITSLLCATLGLLAVLWANYAPASVYFAMGVTILPHIFFHLKAKE